jgi:cellobiose-specific phosphotransferase system component IIC
MLPFNLSMGVMTFFISVGIGASLGRQFQLDPVMSGLLAFMAFYWLPRRTPMAKSPPSTSLVRVFLPP